MATISDKIVKADGTAHASSPVAFCRCAPEVTSIGGVSAAAVTVTTASNGTFSVTLQPGAYRVRWRWGTTYIPDEIGITVPPGSATYTLGDLADADADMDMTLVSILGRTALRAESHSANKVVVLSYLVSEDDGQGGWFEYDADSTADDDGESVIKPDDVDSGSPGRWRRKVMV